MKRKIFLLSLIFIFCLSLTALAQDDTQILADQDENITARDLGIGQPRILPGNPFYFFKNIGRSLTSAFTFNPVAKAELKLKFANEKIIEAKTLSEKTEKPEILKKALDNYSQELKQVEDAVQKIKEEQPEKIDKFLNKFIDNQIKHQKLIGKFEKEMPQEVLEKIVGIKAESAEQLSTVPLRFEEPIIFQERIEKIIEEQPGSEFKHFKNLEVLKEVEQRVPEQAKPAIRQAQENVLKRLENSMVGKASGEAAQATPSTSVKKAPEKFIKYIQKIGGNKEYQQEIIKELEQKSEIEMPADTVAPPSQPRPQSQSEFKPQPPIDTSELDALLKSAETDESNAEKAINDFNGINESEDKISF